jgi:hypothetical protein
LSGSDAADRIDVDIAGMIAALHPGVTVGRAKCPYLLDISGDAVGRCTLPVTGARSGSMSSGRGTSRSRSTRRRSFPTLRG